MCARAIEGENESKGEREGGNYSECKRGATREQLDLAWRISE